jgi:ribosome-binding protein aMBF1 (putative translation factor)
MARRKQPSSYGLAKLSDEQQERLEQIERGAFLHFEGSLDDLEKALGILHLGHHVGWRPLVLIHSKRTIAKFEQILDIRLRDEFPEEGPSAERSHAYVLARKLSNFWKAVSGETPIQDRQHFSKGN